MAEQSEDGQEKTEEPTAKKLEKAAEEGQVLSSKEMFVFPLIKAVQELSSENDDLKKRIEALEAK